MSEEKMCIRDRLHDVLEDTIMTMDEMRAEFGDDVAHLVDGVTKLKHLHLTCLLYTSRCV